MSAQQPRDPKQWAEATLWLNHADADIQAVEALLLASPALINPAAFHCQQAVEKMAKALLVGIGREPPHIHDLNRLYSLLRPDFPDIAGMIEDLTGLTAWYFAVRYPNIASDFAPSLNDIRAALMRLRALRARIAAFAPKAE